MISAAGGHKTSRLPSIWRSRQVLTGLPQLSAAGIFAETRLAIVFLQVSLAGFGALQVPAAFAVNQTGTQSVVPRGCIVSDGPKTPGGNLWEAVSRQATSQNYILLGDFYLQEQSLGCAAFAFETALKLDPGASEARYQLALILIQAGKPERAAEELRSVIAQTPNSVMAHNALGLALQDQGNLDAAAEEFQTAVRLDQSFALGHYNLAYAFSLQKRFIAAAYHLRKAVAIEPDEPSFQLALAIALGEAERFQEAIDLLRNVISTRPESVEAQLNLGTLYSKQKRYLEAVNSFREAIRIEPGNAGAMISLGNALMAKGDQAEAIPLFERYVQVAPEDYRGHLWLGRAYRDMARYEDALKGLRRAATLNPKDSEVAYNLGFVLSKLGQLDLALAELERAKALDPSSSEARYQLAGVLRRLKQTNRANEELQVFKNLERRHQLAMQASNFQTQGNEFLDAGKPRDAAAAYRDALNLDPDNPRIHYNLSIALARLGEHEAQQKELETTIALTSSLPQAYYDLGLLYMTQNKQGEAEEAFKNALRVDPGYSKATDALAQLGARSTQ